MELAFDRVAVADEVGERTGPRWTLPTALAGAAGLAALAPVLRRRLVPLVGPTAADAATAASLAVAGWMGLAVLERVAPHDPAWNRDDGELRTDLLFAFALAPPTTLGASFVRRALTGGRGRRTVLADLPIPVQVALGAVALEGVHYAHHRASHQVPALWRFHAVHHSVRRLYWVNSGRFHPVDLVPLLTAQMVVLSTLGLDPDAVVALQVFKGIHGQLQHANIATAPSVLDQVFSTPEQHRWHHGPDASANLNYGAVLAVFDRVLGTQRRGTPPPLGAGSATDRPARLRDLLARPFRSRPTSPGPSVGAG
ncbi:MAG: sterol desaturase family protein [Acidimicrobiales bacterium]